MKIFDKPFFTAEAEFELKIVKFKGFKVIATVSSFLGIPVDGGGGDKYGRGSVNGGRGSIF